MTSERSEEFDETQHPDDEAGQGLAEYALILGLIAVAAVGGLILVGAGINDLMGWRLFEFASGAGE